MIHPACEARRSGIELGRCLPSRALEDPATPPEQSLILLLGASTQL